MIRLCGAALAWDMRGIIPGFRYQSYIVRQGQEDCDALSGMIFKPSAGAREIGPSRQTKTRPKARSPGN